MNAERWSRLMDAWGFGANLETFDSLQSAYSEKCRYYHTTEHVSACLSHLDDCAGQIERPREVEIALWFHDAIYKPLSSNNEKASADWAVSFLEQNGAADPEIERVRRLIMVTEHNVQTKGKDESTLVDIDLSILGASPEIYEAFEEGIRKEYSVVPSLLYRKKRVEILRGFLERPKIYTSGCFSEIEEHQAKKNLANAISTLLELP